MKNIHLILIILLMIFLFKNSGSKENFSAPTTPGCFMYTNDTCPKQYNFNPEKGKWFRDNFGEKKRKAGESDDKCQKRVSEYNKWCGSTDFKYKFNPKVSNKPKPQESCTLKKAYWESTSDSLGRPCTTNVGGKSECGDEYWCSDVFHNGKGVCHKRNTEFSTDRHSCNPQKENSCPIYPEYKCVQSKSGKFVNDRGIGLCVRKDGKGNYPGAYCDVDNDCRGFENLTCNNNNICELISND